MRLPLALYPLQTSFFHLSSANAVNRMEYTYSMVFSKWCGKFMQWFCYVRVVLLQRMPFNVHAKKYMNSEKNESKKRKTSKFATFEWRHTKTQLLFFSYFVAFCLRAARWNGGMKADFFHLISFWSSSCYRCVCVCMSFIVIVERTMKLC